MKTLKQLITENVAFEDDFLFNEAIRNVVKTWLIQYRKEYEESSKDFAIHRRICIDKLLEDINL